MEPVRRHDRKRLQRERMEIYLVHLLLAYRPLLGLVGLALLLYALPRLVDSLPAGLLLALLAAVPLTLAGSYTAVVLAARLGAWIGSLGRG